MVNKSHRNQFKLGVVIWFRVNLMNIDDLDNMKCPYCGWDPCGQVSAGITTGKFWAVYDCPMCEKRFPVEINIEMRQP